MRNPELIDEPIQPATSQLVPGLISVIMPTYNRAKLVGQAIEAVIAQTYTHWELILVNDGSRDNTREVLDAYAARDPRIRCIHKQNEGIPDTVNRGFNQVRGEFVTWTSDDNLYHPGALAAMKRYLDAHPDVGMVWTDVRDVDADDHVITPHVNTGGPKELETYCGIRGCLLLRTRVWAETGKWHKHWVRCHDYDFYLRVMQRHPVAQIPEVWYDYRCHDESMSGNHIAHLMEEAELMEHHARTRAEVHFFWARNFARIGKWLEKRNEPWRGLLYRLRACRHEPRRIGEFASALKRAIYSSSPQVFKRAWRVLMGRERVATHS